MRVPCQDKKFHPYFQQSFARKRCFVINKRKLEGTRRQMKNTTFAYKLLLEKAAGINFSFLEIRLDSLPRTKPLFTLGLITHPSFFMSFIQFGVERVFYTALFRGWSSQFFKSEFSYCCDSSEASFCPHPSIHPSYFFLSFFWKSSSSIFSILTPVRFSQSTTEEEEKKDSAAKLLSNSD